MDYQNQNQNQSNQDVRDDAYYRHEFVELDEPLYIFNADNKNLLVAFDGIDVTLGKNLTQEEKDKIKDSSLNAECDLYVHRYPKEIINNHPESNEDLVECLVEKHLCFNLGCWDHDDSSSWDPKEIDPTEHFYNFGKTNLKNDSYGLFDKDKIINLKAVCFEQFSIYLVETEDYYSFYQFGGM